jgi:hypothetical protein
LTSTVLGVKSVPAEKARVTLLPTLRPWPVRAMVTVPVVTGVPRVKA